MTVPPPHPAPAQPQSWRHWALVAFGWLCVGLGMLGVVLPVLPTTPFLLLALWAFSRSSRRFHLWLVNHRRLGRYVQDWERDRIIPVRAKVVALASMAASLAWAVHFSRAPWFALAAMAAVMAYGAWYILSKPSKRPPP